MPEKTEFPAATVYDFRVVETGHPNRILLVLRLDGRAEAFALDREGAEAISRELAAAVRKMPKPSLS